MNFFNYFLSLPLWYYYIYFLYVIKITYIYLNLSTILKAIQLLYHVEFLDASKAFDKINY